jgi:hypothetical protein
MLWKMTLLGSIQLALKSGMFSSPEIQAFPSQIIKKPWLMENVISVSYTCSPEPQIDARMMMNVLLFWGIPG